MNTRRCKCCSITLSRREMSYNHISTYLCSVSCAVCMVHVWEGVLTARLMARIEFWKGKCVYTHPGVSTQKKQQGTEFLRTLKCAACLSLSANHLLYMHQGQEILCVLLSRQGVDGRRKRASEFELRHEAFSGRVREEKCCKSFFFHMSMSKPHLISSVKPKLDRQHVMVTSPPQDLATRGQPIISVSKHCIF